MTNFQNNRDFKIKFEEKDLINPLNFSIQHPLIDNNRVINMYRDKRDLSHFQSIVNNFPLENEIKVELYLNYNLRKAYLYVSLYTTDYNGYSYWKKSDLNNYSPYVMDLNSDNIENIQSIYCQPLNCYIIKNDPPFELDIEFLCRNIDYKNATDIYLPIVTKKLIVKGFQSNYYINDSINIWNCKENVCFVSCDLTKAFMPDERQKNIFYFNDNGTFLMCTLPLDRKYVSRIESNTYQSMDLLFKSSFNKINETKYIKDAIFSNICFKYNNIWNDLKNISASDIFLEFFNEVLPIPPKPPQEESESESESEDIPPEESESESEDIPTESESESEDIPPEESESESEEIPTESESESESEDIPPTESESESEDIPPESESESESESEDIPYEDFIKNLLEEYPLIDCDPNPEEEFPDQEQEDYEEQTVEHCSLDNIETDFSKNIFVGGSPLVSDRIWRPPQIIDDTEE